MAIVKNIAECGRSFSDTLSASYTCKINKSTQQKHAKTSRLDPSSERVEPMSTDFLGPVTPKEIGGYAYMAKFTDHYSGVEADFFIEEPPPVLPTVDSSTSKVRAHQLPLQINIVQTSSWKPFLSIRGLLE